jgi:DNA invertase Pin-like site-specific DNA recombinase
MRIEMAHGKHVAYYRVSRERQGRSGLGLEAQRQAVREFLDGGRWSLVGEFTEVESGKHNDRPELAKALHLAKVTGARLVIAKMDRLSRNAVFLLQLRDSGRPFVAADLPDANELTVGILAVVAEDERRRISDRTKAALAVLRQRLAKVGRRLGNPNGAKALQRAAKGNRAAIAAVRQGALRRAQDLQPVIADIEAQGISSNRAIAAELNRRGILLARGETGPRWTDTMIGRLRARLATTTKPTGAG